MKRHAFSAAAFSGALLGAAMFSAPAMAQDEEQFITIGTGGQTGVCGGPVRLSPGQSRQR